MKKNVILLSLATVLFAFSSCTKDDEFDGRNNDHEYVDLGLSVKWATCNVGANSPEELGVEYAWGEITPYVDEYTEYNYVYLDWSVGDISGNPRYDVARAEWGGSWRMPTLAEMKEFDTNCTHQCVVYNGTAGVLSTSKINGNSVFLPAGWEALSDDPNEPAVYLFGYWGSTPDSTEVYNNEIYEACGMGGDGRVNENCYFSVCSGMCEYGSFVRPVID